MTSTLQRSSVLIPAVRIWIFAVTLGFTVIANAGGNETTRQDRVVKPPRGADKVQVYILAGQSNMVGFGYLNGSKLQISKDHVRIFYSSGPKRNDAIHTQGNQGKSI